MTVHACAKCARSISISALSGGNPVALANADQFSLDYGVCKVCKPKGLFRKVVPHYCDRCIAQSAKCPQCGSTLDVTRIPFAARGSLGTLKEPASGHPAPLAILAKAVLPDEVLEAVRRAAPCAVDWLSLERLENVQAVVVAIRCGDIEVIPSALLKRLASQGVPVVAGVVLGTGDAEADELAEMDLREGLEAAGYPGFDLPLIPLEHADRLGEILRSCGVHFHS